MYRFRWFGKGRGRKLWCNHKPHPTMPWITLGEITDKSALANKNSLEHIAFMVFMKHLKTKTLSLFRCFWHPDGTGHSQSLFNIHVWQARTTTKLITLPLVHVNGVSTLDTTSDVSAHKRYKHYALMIIAITAYMNDDFGGARVTALVNWYWYTGCIPRNQSQSSYTNVSKEWHGAHCITYHIAGNFGEVFNLANWQFCGKSPNLKPANIILYTIALCRSACDRQI